MQVVRVAFDVDGTLRCNCTDTCTDPNVRQVERFKAFAHDKNVKLYVWSGGGADYAWRFAQRFELPVKQRNCISKVGAPQMELAFDDQHEFSLATVNIIVREK